MGPELAELFQDAGKTYLQIAERISERCDVPPGCFKIEHLPEAGVVLARRVVQLELVAEPRIVAAEDVAEPVEDETNRAGLQALGQREQEKRNRNPHADFQRHRAGLDQRVAAKQPNAVARFHHHAVGKRVVAVVRDASARRRLLPTIPQPGFAKVIFGLDEKMLFQIVGRRQPVVADVVLRDDGNEVKLARAF